MPRFTKIALAIMLTTAGLVSAKKVNIKYNTAGYNAYANFAFDGCGPSFYSYLDVLAYAAQTKFKATGQNGFKESSSYDDFYLSFSTSSCDDTTVTYQFGYVSDYSDYGGQVPTKFTVETKKLTQADLVGLEVPVYSNTCSYECIEVCYPEIFGYGTCPETELPYEECYTTDCGVEELVGTANVNVYWKLPSGTTSSPAQSSSTYRFRSDDYSSMSRTKGSYRFDIPVIVTATLDGSNLFPSSPVYSYGEIASTTSKDVTKLTNQLI